MVSLLGAEAIDSELASFVWGEKQASQVKRSKDQVLDHLLLMLSYTSKQ